MVWFSGDREDLTEQEFNICRKTEGREKYLIKNRFIYNFETVLFLQTASIKAFDIADNV